MKRRVYVNEQVVELTTMEFNILYYLALHPGWTFTREQLYRYAMSDDFVPASKASPAGSTRYGNKHNINGIQTVHGYGYRFEK